MDIALRVFVVMPYGKKGDIDFDAVYSELIAPALKAAGYDVFRADEDKEAGEIRTGMFQELLLADVVVADLSIDNPNVWYEVGVRHALRARGVVLIASRQGPMPFDVYTDRKLRYHLKDGKPDPEFLEKDKVNLAGMVDATMASWHGKSVSPVYHLLPSLKEPDWKLLRLGSTQELWERHEAWEQRIATARRKQKAGDILVLAEEVPIQALRIEAYRRAGQALRALGAFSFALEQIEKALQIEPKDLMSRHEKGILLGRLERFEEAREWLKAVARDYPKDAETCALLGRAEKDAWLNNCKQSASADEWRKCATDGIALLREAAEAYAAGFVQNPAHYYSGINALTLLHLAGDLAGVDNEDAKRCAAMEGGLRWALQCALARESAHAKDFWARMTLADLELLVSDVPTVKQAYGHAVAAAEQNWFDLDSPRQQLRIFERLNFRAPQVAAALGVLDAALRGLEPPWSPRRVFLFTGHMMDQPERKTERFPKDMEGPAADAIAGKLEEFGADSGDLALCEGACGGDLLFAEAALKRGLRLQLRLPFDEPMFLQKSVAFAGEKWVDRFDAVKAGGPSKVTVLLMPTELGAGPRNRDPYERVNLWQLYSALAYGPSKVRLIALWDGNEGDGPGGTKHMIEAVQARSGRVSTIDAGALLEETRRRRAAR